ncbi:MAG: hypothetical protein ACJA2U_000165 [Marinomonas primoryensis]|jgi:hypothetical protein|tara:strand:+ start:968 stop:1261 length:294 start_codon:yes stop_codon:yes gene_type:complete
MFEEELNRKLNSVGKKVFVECFYCFQRYAFGQITKESAIKELVDSAISNEAGASIRLSNAAMIFKANKQNEALGIVLSSKRISSVVREKAQILMKSS